MKGKQKILLLVCSVIAVVSVSCMAAYALLKTVTETKTNVFASDKSISIDLTEPQWERYGKEAAKVYVPGQTIDKDPTVSLNDESISAYVALKVQFFDEKIVRLRVVGIPHAPGFGGNKARLTVKVNIAGNGKRPCTHFPGFFHGIVEQLLSIALPLVCRCNADRAKGHDR